MRKANRSQPSVSLFGGCVVEMESIVEREQKKEECLAKLKDSFRQLQDYAESDCNYIPKDWGDDDGRKVSRQKWKHLESLIEEYQLLYKECQSLGIPEADDFYNNDEHRVAVGLYLAEIKTFGGPCLIL